MSNKITAIRNWYVIDNILFEGQDPKSLLEDKQFDLYMGLKSALLEQLTTMYSIMGYDSNKNYNTSEELITEAVNYSNYCVNKVKNAVSESKKFRSGVKASLLESQNLTESKIDNAIKSKFKSICLETALIGVPFGLAKKTVQENTKFTVAKTSFARIAKTLVELSNKVK